jgi:hypothetical protein
MANIRFDPDAIIRKNFGGPGGSRLASTTEQLIAKQTVLTRGSTISERSVSLSENSAAENSAPPNATAAPSKGANNQFVGLCDALNQYQQGLVTRGTYAVADEYAIEFAPATIGASEVVKPGPVTYRNTAGKNVKTAEDKLDSKTDSVNVNSQNWNVLAGTQIVQFIDQVMRSSRYITDQQKVNFDENGKQTKNAAAGASGVTAWYKISVTAKQLAYDNKRRDHAYRMTFTISPYAINQMASPYFPDSTYRGAHKAYNYWFTGLNTQILSYEQEYNHAYYTTLSGNADALAVPPPSGRDQFKQTHMATSEQRGQGQANYVNEPADSAASFLYSVSDFSHVQMKIVGDPAFMQQGEVAFGVNARAFEFRPFNADGGINYDSQEVTFTVSFNRPTDYNFNTGIMNTNSASGAPQETFAYIATNCKNVFSKGQFTQELQGSLLPLSNTSKPPSTNGRETTAASASRTTNIKGESLGYEVRDETGALSNLRQNEYGDLYDPAGTAGSALPSPRPAPPPQPATSTGDIQNNTISPEFGFEVASTPQEMNRDT